MMINHNLERSFFSCRVQGMVLEDLKLVALCDTLGDHHAARTFRYKGWDVDLAALS
jgi:hypothetical protein